MSVKNKLHGVAMSAIAVILCSVPNPAQAQTQVETVSVTAVVSNAFTLAQTTAMNFGTVALYNTNTASDIPTIVMDTAGAVTLTDGPTTATVLDVSATGRSAGVFAVSAAVASTNLTISISDINVLTCIAGCSGTPPTIAIGTFVDNGTSSVVTTDGSGAVTVLVGATLSGAVSATSYESGTYQGSYDLTLTY